MIYYILVELYDDKLICSNEHWIEVMTMNLADVMLSNVNL